MSYFRDCFGISKQAEPYDSNETTWLMTSGSLRPIPIDSTVASQTLAQFLTTLKQKQWTIDKINDREYILCSPHGGAKFSLKNDNISLFLDAAGSKKVFFCSFGAIVGVPGSFSGFAGAYQEGGLATALGSMLATYFLNLVGWLGFIQWFLAPENRNIPLLNNMTIIAAISALPSAVLAALGGGQAAKLISGIPPKAIFPWEALVGGANEVVSTGLNRTSISSIGTPLIKIRGAFNTGSWQAKASILTGIPLLLLMAIIATACRAHSLFAKLKGFIPEPVHNDTVGQIAKGVRTTVIALVPLLASGVGFAMFFGSLLDFCQKINNFVRAVVICNFPRKEYCPDAISFAAGIIVLYCAYYAGENFAGLAKAAEEDFFAWLEGFTTTIYVLARITATVNMLNRYSAIRGNLVAALGWASERYERKPILKTLEKFKEQFPRTVTIAPPFFSAEIWNAWGTLMSSNQEEIEPPATV